MPKSKPNNELLKYSEMETNPFTVPDGLRIFEHYKVFIIRPWFTLLPVAEASHYYDDWTLDHQDELIRFVVLFIDITSPYADMGDIKARMEICMLDLSISKKSRVGKEIMNGTDYFYELIYRYFKIVNAGVYEDWLSLCMNVSQINHVLRKPIDITNSTAVNNRDKFANALEELRNKILQIQQRLFPSSGIEKIINLVEEQESLEGYAEEFAEPSPQELLNYQGDDDDGYDF